MSEYISQEMVLSTIWKTSAEHNVFFPAIMLDAIKSIPAADVVPVVRCKNCRFYEKNQPDDGWGMCRNSYAGFEERHENFFCAVAVSGADMREVEE